MAVDNAWISSPSMVTPKTIITVGAVLPSLAFIFVALRFCVKGLESQASGLG